MSIRKQAEITRKLGRKYSFGSRRTSLCSSPERSYDARLGSVRKDFLYQEKEEPSFCSKSLFIWNHDQVLKEVSIKYLNIHQFKIVWTIHNKGKARHLLQESGHHSGRYICLIKNQHSKMATTVVGLFAKIILFIVNFLFWVSSITVTKVSLTD